MTYQYITSGSLPEGTLTYVKRKADNELYEELKAGQFCYIFNASKAGKSSLQIQVKSKLEKAGFACVLIDLQPTDTNLSPDQFYNEIILDIVTDLKLEVNLKDWREKNNWLSPLKRFRNFVELVMLAQCPKNIVIFFDEVNHITKFKFATDDFFGFIRFCYNQRAINPNYNRLVFCLSGIASPSTLIKNTQITPFNISKAISLEPFELHDVEPLQRGLKGKFDDTKAVMKQILYWTGGQPFLTQKLCKLMIEDTEKNCSRSVEEVVREKIIKDWRSQEDVEHLATIYKRIIKSQKASHLLELYQQVLQLKQVENNDSSEASELILSGLVVKKQEKLKVYNLIYQQVFNLNWIEIELNNLRPYSENYHTWLASKKQDKSRLLRGEALQEALKWASVRSLSSEERAYLETSREQQRQEQQAAKDREADLERERENRKVVEQRNQVLKEANKKAEQLIRDGTTALGISLSLAVIFGITSVFSGKDLVEKHNYLKTAAELSKLAGEAQAEAFQPEAAELFSIAGRSTNIKNKNLQLALVNIGIAYGNLEIKKEDWKTQVDKYLKKVNINIISGNSLESLQIQILFYKVKGKLQNEKQEITETIKFYKKAYDLFKDLKSKTSTNISPPFNEKIPLEKSFLSKEVVEALHREFINLLSKGNNKNSLKQEVENSLKEHYYNQLDNLLKNERWEQADKKTTSLILYILRRDREKDLDEESINECSCDDLRRIDKLWVKHSQGKFGFSKQKEIYIKKGNRLGIELENWNDKDLKNIERFPKAVGWSDKNTAKDNSELTTGRRGRGSGYPQGKEEKMKGYYPYDLGSVILWTSPKKSSYYPFYPYRLPLLLFFSRAETCKV